MKRLLFLFLLAAATTGSYGQKNIDLAIQLLSPAENGNYINLADGDIFTYQIAITNNGADIVEPTDSIFIILDVSMAFSNPLGGLWILLPITDSTISVGETDTFSFSMTEGDDIYAPYYVNFPENETIDSVPAFVFGKDENGIPFIDAGYSGTGDLNDFNLGYFSGNNVDYNHNIVFSYPPVDSVVLNVSGGQAPIITTYNGSLYFNATVFPANANQQVTWSMTPPDSAILNDGMLSAFVNTNVWVKATSVEDPTKSDSMLVAITGQYPDSMVVSTVGNVSPIIDAPGGTLDLHAQIFPADFYQGAVWSIIPVTGDASIEGINHTVTAISNGTVWAKAFSMSFSNLADSILITISNQELSLKNIANEKQLKLFPNPTEDNISISYSLPHPKLKISLSDVSGKIIFNNDVAANRLNNPYFISLQTFPAGVYFIHLSGDDFDIKRTLVKRAYH